MVLANGGAAWVGPSGRTRPEAAACPGDIRGEQTTHMPGCGIPKKGRLAGLVGGGPESSMIVFSESVSYNRNQRNMRPTSLCAIFATTLYAAWPASAALAAGPTTFKPTQGCEKIEHFDPEWQAYNGDFGLNRPDAYRKHGPIWGFYQMRLVGDTLYATFGGDVENPKGTTPGALVALDAESMAFQRLIALPFAAHALAIDATGKRAVATHTAANAFSLIDLERRRVNCRKADTVLDGETYRGRYVTMDARGNIYINYNNFADENESGVVMKYTPNGEHAPDFSVQVTEHAMVIPLTYLGGQLLTGGKGLKAIDPQSGNISALTAERSSASVYNYAQGPGELLLASDYNAAARPNMMLIDPATGARSELLTAAGSVETAWIAESGQAIATNNTSGSVTIAALPQGATGFVPGQFVNIQFDGDPATMTTRRTDRGTDIYVSVKHWKPDENREKSTLLHRIRIAPTVRGIEGITRPGACTITSFNMADRTVSAPRPCDILDAPGSFRQTVARLEREVKLLQTELGKERRKLAEQQRELDEIQKLRGKTPSTNSHQTITRLTSAVESQQTTVQALERELAEDEKGMKIFQHLGSQPQPGNSGH